MTSPITTHVLDTATGRPAVGMRVRLERLGPSGSWDPLGEGITNDDGRIRDLLPAGPAPTGTLRLTFGTGQWYQDRGEATFYPEVSVAFTIGQPEQHFHVPLLLSPFGYSTYRGS